MNTKFEKKIRVALVIIFIITAIIVELFAPFKFDKSIPSASASETTSEDYYNPAWDKVAEPQPYIPTLNISLSEDMQHLLYDRCNNIGMDYALMLGIMDAESDFIPNAISFTGVAHGIMQVNYCNDSWLIEDYGFNDLNSIEQNAIAGIIIFQGYLERYGSINKALMAYNMGPSRAKELWDEGVYTSPYVKEVLHDANYYRTLIEEQSDAYYQSYGCL